jgi:PAS domain S-box-containing protein
VAEGRPKRRMPAATSLIGSGLRADRGMVGRVASSELRQAVSEDGVPPVLAWDKAGTVRLANQGGAATFGLSIEEIVGMALTDLAGPADEIEHTVADMTAGRVVAVHSRRTARVRGGPDQPVLATSRSIEADGNPGGVTVFVPECDSGRLGRDPRRTWQDLVPVAIGFTDRDWIVETVSTEVRELIDLASEEVAGRSLLELPLRSSGDPDRQRARPSLIPHPFPAVGGADDILG